MLTGRTALGAISQLEQVLAPAGHTLCRCGGSSSTARETSERRSHFALLKGRVCCSYPQKLLLVRVVGIGFLTSRYCCRFDGHLEGAAIRWVAPNSVSQRGNIANYRVIKGMILAQRAYQEIVTVVGCSRREVSRVKETVAEGYLRTNDLVAVLHPRTLGGWCTWTGTGTPSI